MAAAGSPSWSTMVAWARAALPTTWAQRVAELKALGDVDLATYLYETGLELEDAARRDL